MPTIIHSNGGGNPQPIEALFARLESDTLDRTFEAFGDFVTVDPINLRGEPMTAPGGAAIFGNFLTYSHVFRIETDDIDLIQRLSSAIATNKATPAYKRQPPYFDTRKLQIVRHRFSTTQGEAEMIYDGRRIGQYGDTITINGRGVWEGLRDDKWTSVARDFLAREHAAKFEREFAA